MRDEQTRAASAAARLTWEQRRAELTVRLGEVAAGLLERAAAGEAQEAKALMTACAIGIDKAEHRSTPTHPGERIAAARLGFGPVTALDSDPLAIEATTANARQNGVVLDRVERANLREQAPPQADVVLANLMRPLLLRVAELMPEPPRALIASGLLDHEADKVAAAFSPLRERRRVIDKGWGALLLRAP